MASGLKHIIKLPRVLQQTRVLSKKEGVKIKSLIELEYLALKKKTRVFAVAGMSFPLKAPHNKLFRKKKNPCIIIKFNLRNNDCIPNGASFYHTSTSILGTRYLSLNFKGNRCIFYFISTWKNKLYVIMMYTLHNVENVFSLCLDNLK